MYNTNHLFERIYYLSLGHCKITFSVRDYGITYVFVKVTTSFICANSNDRIHHYINIPNRGPNEKVHPEGVPVDHSILVAAVHGKLDIAPKYRHRRWLPY